MSLPNIFQLHILIPWIISMAVGILVGGTPGLTATMAVALIVPITYYMDPLAGLAMILGVSFTSIFAGDIPATFLRIPGTPASAAAVLDGFEMSKKRERFACSYYRSNMLSHRGSYRCTITYNNCSPLSKICLEVYKFSILLAWYVWA